MSLNTSQLDAITRQVYRQFPELKGERPTVQRQATPALARSAGAGVGPEVKAKRPGAAATERYVLTYKGSHRTPDGRTLIRIVRATADERGRILKITTSK